ncbi:hypothetical protein [Elioraea sp.]|jgi:hypothetical protein|uniref:hypothetical protein n=1 Tax=Elioraea sp. TaxID=2185103 RepID=UPI003F6F34D8
MAGGPLVLDSVTHLPSEARGRVALCGSHGGIYSAWYAAQRGVVGVVLHDAGIGRDRAGISGLDWLARIAVPAAAIGHLSARIGDGADCLARGVLSAVNAQAASLGLAVGMSAAEAVERLAAAGLLKPPLVPVIEEARTTIAEAGRGGIRVLALDSNSLVLPEDAGHIIVTGSHGGLPGGKPAMAVKQPVLAAVYNDAGGGIDAAGFTRLPALDGRGIAGATVSAESARIGEAMSTWSDGVISAVNDTAARLGGRVGQSCREFVEVVRAAATRRIA